MTMQALGDTFASSTEAPATNRLLSCTRCRNCGKPTHSDLTMTLLIGGMETTVRDRRCKSCGSTYQTAEAPLEVARDVWEGSA